MTPSPAQAEQWPDLNFGGAFGSRAAAGGGGGGANVFVATTGNDANPGTQVSPVLTFQRAYLLCPSGGTVEVAAGTYASQELDFDATKSAADVTFRAPIGSPVSAVFVPKLDFGSIAGDGSTINMSAAHVVVSNMTIGGPQTAPTIDNRVLFNGSAHHVTVQNCVLTRFEILGSNNISILANDIGAAKANANCTAGSRLQTGTGNSAPSTILIRQNAIHDIGSSDFVNFHVDGIVIFDCNGVVIDRNKFYKNAITNIRLQAATGGGQQNVTVTNNWFGSAFTGDTAAQYGVSNTPNGDAFDVDTPIPGMICKWNTFCPVDRATIVLQTDMGTAGNPALLTGNVLTLTDYWGTLTGVVFKYNVELYFNPGINPSGLIGDGTNVLSATPPALVNGVSTSAMDYNLTGASGVADNFVAPSVPGGFVTPDFNGVTRPQNVNADAGACERNL